MTRQELRALWDAKEAAHKAYMNVRPDKAEDPDARFDLALEEARLCHLAAKAAVAFDSALKLYGAERAVAA